MNNTRPFLNVAGLVCLVVSGHTVLFHAGSPINQTQPATSAQQSSSAQGVIIRYEEIGGLQQAAATRVPEWSLYGDGELLWTEGGPPTPGFTGRVWSGHLTDDQILQLMNFAEQIGFWQLADSYQPSAQVSADRKVITLDPEAMPDQHSSVLTVRWKQREKRVVVYPAGWKGAPDSFRVLRDRLLQTRAARQREFQPQGFYVTVRKVAANDQHAAPEWPIAHIDLAATQSEMVRLTREQGLALAEVLKAGAPIVVQSGQSFSVQLFADPPRQP